MKKLVYLFLFSASLISCSKSDDGNDDHRDYIIYPNASLNIIETENSKFIEVEEGNNLVFEYKFSTEGAPEIADDEFTEIVYFELNANTEDFSFNENDFEGINAYLGRFCFCGNTGFFKITSGTMNGEKTGNNQWRVSINVEAMIEANENVPEMNFTAMATGTFRPRN